MNASIGQPINRHRSGYLLPTRYRRVESGISGSHAGLGPQAAHFGRFAIAVVSFTGRVGFHLAGPQLSNQAFILLGTALFGFEFECVQHGASPFTAFIKRGESSHCHNPPPAFDCANHIPKLLAPPGSGPGGNPKPLFAH